jgi:hypothetical protein
VEKLSERDLRLWLWFLQQNQDFEQYCLAKREKNIAECERIEKQFPKVAEIYDDWGDVHETDILASKKSFKAWLEPRAALFNSELTAAQLIDDPASYRPRPGYLLVEIPLYEDSGKIHASLGWLLHWGYWARSMPIQNDEDSFTKEFRQTLPPQKYKLHHLPEGLNEQKFKILLKGACVGIYRKKMLNGKPLSITATVLAIKQDPDNPFGWKLTKDERAAVKRGTFAKSILGGSEVTLVKRHKKEFDAYVRNTIHGRFPDNS